MNMFFTTKNIFSEFIHLYYAFNTTLGWEGDKRGRAYGDICIHIADSLCYTAETNTPL